MDIVFELSLSGFLRHGNGSDTYPDAYSYTNPDADTDTDSDGGTHLHRSLASGHDLHDWQGPESD